MSTFDGRIREFPNVAVDCYRAHRTAVQAFFLSHCHADHLDGLTSPNFCLPLYCSFATSRILPLLNEGKYLHLKPYLTPLPYETPTRLDALGLTVTLFRAPHCPGATMFLFEGTAKTVLYTGDLRAEHAFLDGLRRYKEDGIIPPVDTLYLDTTFCDEDYVAFPTRAESALAAIQLLKRTPSSLPVRLPNTVLGMEYVWVQIAKEFEVKIYVSPQRYALYQSVHDVCDDELEGESILPYLTTDPAAARFHAAGSRLRPGALTVRTAAMQWKRILRNAQKGKHPGDGITCKKSDLSYHILYSQHSSLEELQELVAIIRPREVTPCVLDNDFHGTRRIAELLSLGRDTASGVLDVSMDITPKLPSKPAVLPKTKSAVELMVEAFLCDADIPTVALPSSLPPPPVRRPFFNVRDDQENSSPSNSQSTESATSQDVPHSGEEMWVPECNHSKMKSPSDATMEKGVAVPLSTSMNLPLKLEVPTIKPCSLNRVSSLLSENSDCAAPREDENWIEVESTGEDTNLPVSSSTPTVGITKGLNNHKTTFREQPLTSLVQRSVKRSVSACSVGVVIDNPRKLKSRKPQDMPSDWLSKLNRRRYRRPSQKPSHNNSTVGTQSNESIVIDLTMSD
ncbi:beta-lactamase-like protein [Gaertneriomyces semiglobifer]|nr:beta-lactamase-like protein [Gaertneriomyces semiglobifer]